MQYLLYLVNRSNLETSIARISSNKKIIIFWHIVKKETPLSTVEYSPPSVELEEEARPRDRVGNS